MSLHYIVQISDTHLFKSNDIDFNGCNPYKNLKKTIENVLQLSQEPELIILSGDCSQDCSEESYRHLKNLLDGTKIKYILFPGNHDDLSILNKVFGYKWSKSNVDFSYDFYNWFFYIIDTARFPMMQGELTDEQISRLKSSLEKNKTKPAIIFMHHHPVKINSRWLDEMDVTNPEGFNDLVQKYKQVKAVLFGHIHQVFEANINGIFYGSAPSTAFQVKSQADEFSVDKLIPGYRLIELDGNNIHSTVRWL